MTTTMWILLASLFVCVALSAFFSSSETAFSAANKVRLKTMVADGNKRARLALAMADPIDHKITETTAANGLT